MKVGDYFVEDDTGKVYEVVDAGDEWYSDTMPRAWSFLVNIHDETDEIQDYDDWLGGLSRITDMEVLAYSARES